MSDAVQRARQQQRIQQLHERLELYNITDRHADLTSTSSGGVGPSSATSLPPASAVKASTTKPSRTAPVISSPNLNSRVDPVLNTFSFTSSLPSQAKEAGMPSFTLGPQRAKESQATNRTSASGLSGGSRASPELHHRPQVQPQNPAPAPRLARSLADEFGGSAASPIRASPVGAVSHSPLTPNVAAAFPGAPGRSSHSVAFQESEAAEQAAAASTGLQRQASDVPDYDEDSMSEQSGNIQYDVEEIEEYSEDEEASGEEAGEHTIKTAAARLEKMLQRLHHACSGSSERAMASSSLQKAIAAAVASFPLAGDARMRSASPVAASSPHVGAANGTTSPVGATHPFLQQAAELYRQRHLYRVSQTQRNSDHLDADHEWSSDQETSATTSTSEPTEELNENFQSRAASGSSAASVDDEEKYEVTATTRTPVPYFTSSPVGQESSSDVATATRAAANGTASVTAVPSSALCFDQLEVAYRRLLILQEGVNFISERARPERFPHPLPRQEDAHGLAKKRDIFVKRDSEMRAAPPAGVSLEDLRHQENTSIKETLESIRERFEIAIKSLKPVSDRESFLEGKRRVLKQRESDLEKQRESRRVIEREIAAMEQRLAERSEQLTKREEDYNARLQQHDQQQKVAQERIGEVEQLSKQVSSWLSILEERDRRLTVKEKRLQRVQEDLTKRTEDIAVWKRATQRIKQIPPPSSTSPLS